VKNASYQLRIIDIKSWFFLFLFLSKYQFASSQEILWAQTGNKDKKTNFTKVIGQNKHGVYVLKHKNSTFKNYFIIEQFDHKMHLKQSKNIKIGKAKLEKIIVTENEVVYFTRQFMQGYYLSLAMNSLDSNLMFTDFNSEIISNVDLPGNFDEFYIHYSDNKKRFSVCYFQEVGKYAEINIGEVNDRKIINQNKVLLKATLQELKVNKFLFDNLGNFYMNYEINKIRKSIPISRVFCMNLEKKFHIDTVLNDQDTYINDINYTYNSVNQIVHVAGFWGKSDDQENKGYFYLSITPNSFKFNEVKFHDFDRKLVSSIIGLKFEQKGENLSKFKIKKIINKYNGDIVVIAEKSFVATQSDVIYINGAPQTSFAKIFTNDEVLLLTINKIGELIWSEVLFKNQSSINDGGLYNSIVVMTEDDKINILYNDRLSSNSDVIQVTYNEDGTHSKKILINNEQFYALIIPAESNQVTGNSVVIPVNQNKDFTYFKLYYHD
jgi:hypothetical protein